MASSSHRLSRRCAARVPRSGWVVALGLVLSRPVLAADPDPTAIARQHFERGYAAVQRGEVDVAVAEFERAYAASPKPSVLFNLGQAYASAGRAVEAVETLGRYLELAGDAVPAERRALVESLVAYHSRSLGEVTLDALPQGSQVTLDGRAVGTAPLKGAIRLARGTHALVVSRPGYESALRYLDVRAGERASLEVVLAASALSARIRVTCPVPDASVSVDGREVGRTPLRAPLPAQAGARTLEFARSGYVTSRRTLELRAGADAEIACGLDAAPPTAAFARLSLTHPAGTQALLDGRPFTGQLVPPGRHRLVVSGPGFERTERTVSFSPGAVSTLVVIPRLDEASASRELGDRRSTQRFVAYVAGGAGLALGAAALGLYVYNNGKYAQWKRDSEAFTNDYVEDPNRAAPSRLDRLLADERAIRNRDALALGAGVLGGALLSAAVGLYLTAQPDEPRVTVTGTLLPLPGLGFRGGF